MGELVKVVVALSAFVLHGCERTPPDIVSVPHFASLDPVAQTEAMTTIQRRFEVAGYPGAVVTPSTDKRELRVEYAGVRAPGRDVVHLATRACELRVTLEADPATSIISNADLADVQARNSADGPYLMLSLTEDGAARLRDVTRRSVGQAIFFAVDGEILTIAEVQGEFGSPFVVTLEDGRQAPVLAACISGGALRIDLADR